MNIHIRLALLVSMVLVSTFSFSQTFEIEKKDTINRMDAAGLKQGKWVVRAKNNSHPKFAEGALVEEAFYKDGKKEGLRKQFHPNGQLRSEVPFKANRPTGSVKFFYDNGVLAEEGTWVFGNWDGNYKNYYKGGNIENDLNYSYGKKDGYQKMYHKNGKLKREGTWKNGIPEGIVKEYEEDGTLVSEEFYANGLVDPKASKYHKSITNLYTEDQADSVGVFSGNGYYQFKTKSGKISREGTFKGGKLMDGKQYYYEDDGELTQTLIYKDGKVIDTIDED